jgi:autophagy-related protein 9
MQTDSGFLRPDHAQPPSEDLPGLALTRQHSSERWDAVSDLDKFFTAIYNYYLGKGFRAIVLLRATDLLSLVFTTIFTTFLLLFVDWGELLSCNVQNCESVIALPKQFGLYEVASVLFASVYGLYSLYYFYYFLQVVQETNDTFHIFTDKLGISDQELPYITWDVVVNKLIEKQQKYRFCIVKNDLSALDISNRIMRRDNYLIGLVMNGVVVPSVCLPPEGAQLRFTKVTEWVLRFALLDFILSPKTFRLRRAAKNSPETLRKRFFVCGIFYCLVMVPLFIFSIMTAFFRHKQELESMSQPTKRRCWTNLYRWTFREFNELPHFFEDRVGYLSKHADLYLQSFKAPLLSEIIARCVAYISGSLLAVLFAVAFYDDRLPFNVHIAGINLVAYMLILGGTVAFCRLLIRVEDSNYELKHPAAHMLDMVQYGHSLPLSWRESPTNREVRDEVTRQFKHRALVMADEVISVLWMPYYLFSFLPAQALSNLHAEICQFLSEFTVTEEGIGDICSYSAFQLDEITSKVTENEHEKLLRSYHSFNRNLRLSSPDESFESVRTQFRYLKLRGESVLQE